MVHFYPQLFLNKSSENGPYKIHYYCLSSPLKNGFQFSIIIVRQVIQKIVFKYPHLLLFKSFQKPKFCSTSPTKIDFIKTTIIVLQVFRKKTYRFYIHIWSTNLRNCCSASPLKMGLIKSTIFVHLVLRKRVLITHNYGSASH